MNYPYKSRKYLKRPRPQPEVECFVGPDSFIAYSGIGDWLGKLLFGGVEVR